MNTYIGRTRFLEGTLIVLACAGIPAFAQVAPQNAGAQTGEWRGYGGDKSFQRYSPLDLINRQNVKNVGVVWSRPGIDPLIKSKFPELNSATYFKGTPVMVGGVLYAPDGVGLVEAFDAATGETKWVQQPVEPTPREAAGQPTRGVAYWKKNSDERIISIRGEYLYVLDARSGALIREFGENGRVWLNRHLPNSARYSGSPGPFLVNDVIVVGGNGVGSMGDGGWEAHAAPEDVRGYDVYTGKQLWTFHIIPQPGDPARETWGKGSADIVGNMAAWAPLTADEALDYIYIPFTAPTVSYYGGHRPGMNLYADSLVCLEGKTGKLVWYYQLIHHNLWEYDAATPPILGEITVDGKRIKAVFASNKTGFLYVFDRVTGKPVWPIEERPVPKSNVPGEEAWPTQPFPTKPPAYDRQGISEEDLIDFTPELHRRALEIANQYVMGPLYTPPTLRSDEPGGRQGTIALPTDWGSGNWNTGAFDPETGMYYAVSATQPVIFALIKATDPKATMAYSEPGGGGARQRANQQAGANAPGQASFQPPLELQPATNPQVARPPQSPYGRLTIDGLPIVKPPYGRITALDLNKGTKVWMAANGDGPRDHPLIKDLHLPPMGNPGRPAPLLTKALLFLGDSSDAVMGRAGVSGPAKFRAYDKATGELVWQTDLPVGTTGGPITYLAKGKQYIVLPVGGAGYGGGWICLGVKDAQ
jgi:glucose dehydrogenase